MYIKYNDCFSYRLRNAEERKTHVCQKAGIEIKLKQFIRAEDLQQHNQLSFIERYQSLSLCPFMCHCLKKNDIRRCSHHAHRRQFFASTTKITFSLTLCKDEFVVSVVDAS